MATVDLTESRFESAVPRDGIVPIDFCASWCGPFRKFASLFERTSQAHPDILFGKIDTEAEPALASGMSNSSIPALIAFRDGVLVDAQPGALPAPALDRLLVAARTLDMDAIRAVPGRADRGQHPAESRN